MAIPVEEGGSIGLQAPPRPGEQPTGAADTGEGIVPPAPPYYERQPTSKDAVYQAQRTFEDWKAQQHAQGYKVDIDPDGNIMVTRPVSSGRGSDEKITMVPSLDPWGQQLYTDWLTAKGDLAVQGSSGSGSGSGKGGGSGSGGSRGGGGGSGGASKANAAAFIDVESLKSKEARDRFLDGMDRIKAVYNLQDEEQQYAASAQSQNAKAFQAISSGDLDPGMMTVMSDQRPSPLYSQQVERTVPRYTTPDYLNTDFLPANYGDPNSETPDQFGVLPGFAEGSRKAMSEKPVIDPEIAWMIGKPDIPLFKEPPPPPPPASWTRGKSKPGARR